MAVLVGPTPGGARDIPTLDLDGQQAAGSYHQEVDLAPPLVKVLREIEAIQRARAVAPIDPAKQLEDEPFRSSRFRMRHVRYYLHHSPLRTEATEDYPPARSPPARRDS